MEVFGYLLVIWIVGVFPWVGVAIELVALIEEAAIGSCLKK